MCYTVIEKKSFFILSLKKSNSFFFLSDKNKLKEKKEMHSGYAYYIKGNILQINDINLAYESNAAGSCVAEINCLGKLAI